MLLTSFHSKCFHVSFAVWLCKSSSLATCTQNPRKLLLNITYFAIFLITKCLCSSDTLYIALIGAAHNTWSCDPWYYGFVGGGPH
ncbi:hypothetical protein GDO86_001028 [Hymenochirus boettgeri]|uniref:Uncharacterized protein n=1 Tax=Hymenochirus boettgeri TaxID=247094 RepID=A0A8T2KGI0_9PIPI|nr:hypothetical protein GDO86_001028 [Hymenochirus boettgeri]